MATQVTLELALSVPQEAVLPHVSSKTEAEALLLTGSLGRELDALIAALQRHREDSRVALQDTWEGLMSAGQAALLPHLPALAQAARQLAALLAAAQQRLRVAAAELRRLADLNAAFARELTCQPACARLRRSKVLLAWCEGMAAERAEQVAANLLRPHLPLAQAVLALWPTVGLGGKRRAGGCQGSLAEREAAAKRARLVALRGDAAASTSTEDRSAPGSGPGSPDGPPGVMRRCDRAGGVTHGGSAELAPHAPDANPGEPPAPVGRRDVPGMTKRQSGPVWETGRRTCYCTGLSG
ncbi:hypothetical protein WJX81_008272 [Elliptochloris bilobata]|uniref:Uncharacterized protein n=1 Tax=Elliptochloris bilobata TaxID=381761 RepID=A0AAW1RW75_9CHLO